jgi:4-hydroxy-tetrahydrodipicolinate reductase
MSIKVKVAIIGYQGKMGALATAMLANLPAYQLVARIGSKDNLSEILAETMPDLALELTSSVSVLHNVNILINHGIKTIVGSSGLLTADIDTIASICARKQLGCLIVPNFSLGMALMCKFLHDIAKYYTDCAITEFHHCSKQDKPSGTARHLAHITNTREQDICSHRRPNVVAKHQLYINTEHERLIIDHESFSRTSFIAGMQLALAKIMPMTQLIVGLENIL